MSQLVRSPLLGTGLVVLFAHAAYSQVDSFEALKADLEGVVARGYFDSNELLEFGRRINALSFHLDRTQRAEIRALTGALMDFVPSAPGDPTVENPEVADLAERFVRATTHLSARTDERVVYNVLRDAFSAREEFQAAVDRRAPWWLKKSNDVVSDILHREFRDNFLFGAQKSKAFDLWNQGSVSPEHISGPFEALAGGVGTGLEELVEGFRDHLVLVSSLAALGVGAIATFGTPAAVAFAVLGGIIGGVRFSYHGFLGLRAEDPLEAELHFRRAGAGIFDIAFSLFGVRSVHTALKGAKASQSSSSPTNEYLEGNPFRDVIRALGF